MKFWFNLRTDFTKTLLLRKFVINDFQGSHIQLIQYFLFSVLKKQTTMQIYLNTKLYENTGNTISMILNCYVTDFWLHNQFQTCNKLKMSQTEKTKIIMT